MLGLKKVFYRWLNKRRLVRQAHHAIDFATQTYWAQLALEEGQRDDALMKECLSVIRCASSILYEGARRSQPELFSCSAPIRRAVTLVTSLLIVIALSTGVAYAMGYDLWNIVFNAENGAAVMQGEPLGDGERLDISFSSIPPTDGFIDFESVSEACDTLSISPVLLSGASFDELREKTVYAAVSEAAITLCIDYEYNDSQIHYTTVCHPDSTSAFLLAAEGFQGESTSREIGGVTFYIVEGGDELAIMWCENCYAYQIITDVAYDELMGALEILY